MERMCASMSVFKIYIALAILKQVDEGKITLESTLLIPKEEWEQDTWSPLQKKHQGKDSHFTLAALLDATLILSDNIATDALIDQLGGIAGLNKTLHAMGISYADFRVDEREMQLSHAHAAQNKLSPKQVVSTLRDIHQGKLLSREATAQLINRMLVCQTGKEKIRAQFPSLPVGNRSGGSGRDKQGAKLGDNDAGFVILPDGQTLYLTIFINHSRLSDKQHIELIRDLCKGIKDTIITPYPPYHGHTRNTTQRHLLPLRCEHTTTPRCLPAPLPRDRGNSCTATLLWLRMGDRKRPHLGHEAG